MDADSLLPQDHPALDDVAALDGDLLDLESHIKKEDKRKRKKEMRRAPQAPRRFKSSYICFFMDKQPEIKAQLGKNATVANVSKRSAELWKNLSDSEKVVWEEMAARDKARYNLEKSQYTGPWQIPWRRLKKDATAPKRPMSAFLFFSQTQRQSIKAARPGIKNTEVSKILGEMWRALTPEEKEPHVTKEKEERAKYMVKMKAWREKKEAEAAAQRKALTEQIEMVAKLPTSVTDDQNPIFSDPFATAPTPPANMFTDPLYSRAGLGLPMSYPPFPAAAPGRPIILAPTGMPHYSSMAPSNGFVLPSQPAAAVFQDAPNPLSPDAFDFSADPPEDSEV